MVGHCIEEFREKYLHSQVMQCVDRFGNTGFTARHCCIRKPTEVIAEVEDRANRSPKKSIQRLAQEIELFYGPTDFKARLIYRRWFQ